MARSKSRRKTSLPAARCFLYLFHCFIISASHFVPSHRVFLIDSQLGFGFGMGSHNIILFAFAMNGPLGYVVATA